MPEYSIDIGGYAGNAELSMDLNGVSKDDVKAVIANPEKSSHSGDTVVALGNLADRILRVVYKVHRENETTLDAYILGVSSEDSLGYPIPRAVCEGASRPWYRRGGATLGR